MHGTGRKERIEMGPNVMTVVLTQQEMLRIEMIVVDGDKDEALVFLNELRRKIEDTTVRGMKSHLDV
jgi:hypothetical protein